MKDLTKVITTFILIFAGIWIVSFIVPKLYELYNTDTIIEKTDTIIKNDTIYLDAEVTDTLPKTVYETIVKRDTVYRLVGDSIEAQPRVISIKKKLSKTPLNWKQTILWKYNMRQPLREEPMKMRIIPN